MSDLNVFRQETREWLEENCPQSMRSPIIAGEGACWGGRKWVFASEDQ
ncbi:MAG TPA: acyl-CoA dehydrogenase, partial [Porticoccaceae bacterium]|nr:acyl-CoA dehydrogenase [Porticoccaceae bacterium]